LVSWEGRRQLYLRTDGAAVGYYFGYHANLFNQMAWDGFRPGAYKVPVSYAGHDIPFYLDTSMDTSEMGPWKTAEAGMKAIDRAYPVAELPPGWRRIKGCDLYVRTDGAAAGYRVLRRDTFPRLGWDLFLPGAYEGPLDASNICEHHGSPTYLNIKMITEMVPCAANDIAMKAIDDTYPLQANNPATV
jgi:hypothetical protein